MKQCLVCVFALVVGCTSAEEPSNGVFPASDAGSDTRVVGSSGKDAGGSDDGADDTSMPADTGTMHEDSAPADTAAESADTGSDTGPPPTAVDCLSGGSYGPSSYSLVDFHYEMNVSGCTSSACSDFVTFNPSCVMTLQVSDVVSTATVDASDCELFKRWLTSDLLVTYLRDTVTCYYGKDGTGVGAGAFESSEVQLADGMASKKTWSCPDEPFKSHRNCINVLRAKYFPGK